MTVVWRIGYCPQPAPSVERLLSELGFGATLGNGRWHRQSSQMMVYAASSRSLCHLEKRVHCNGAQPVNQALMRLVLPKGASIASPQDFGLSPSWGDDMAHTQDIGMRWLAECKTLAMWVPSFVVAGDANLLINPAHADYRKIELSIEEHPFRFDDRLF